VLIVDAHLDLAWNALQWGRDLTRPVAEIRAAEAGVEEPGRGRGTVALPELARGRVAVTVATVIARCTGVPEDGLDYQTVEEASRVARDQLAWYRAREREGGIVVIEDAATLRGHVARWREWERLAVDEPPALGVVLSCEGADPIAEPDVLDAWRDAGLRVVGLSHYGTGRYAGGTHTDGGLTERGRALLREMGRHGMPLDLTHLTDVGVAEALDLHEGPVLASHSNARALVPHDRQLTDPQILAITARDGVVGVALDCWMLDPGWVLGQAENEVVLADVAGQVDHVCQLTGSSRHVGIGSDLDGGFGREQSPSDLDTVADLQLLAGLLRDRGYGEDDVSAVMHGNWLRFLERALP
jgi:membrane dipeptidase